jgi:hypothetical protein
MDQFDEKLDRFFTEMRSEMADVKQSLVQVKGDVSETKEIVEAWGAVKTAGKFIKWLGSIATGAVAFYLLAKAGMQHMVGK